MRIVGETGREDIAIARIAEMRAGRYVEFVESVQPPIPRHRKWVLIVSTMFGCPVGCLMCDAGGHYGGNLTADEIIAQIDYMVRSRFPDGDLPMDKFKVQFARMGEPSLNPAVLDVLEALPDLYEAPGLIPSISTVAPAAAAAFFERLKHLKRRLYPSGRFQLQFSIHTTDESLRDKLVPISKWDLKKIAAFGEAFHEEGGRKITLNAAPAGGMPLDADVLLRFFDPDRFLFKITPLNPTYQAAANRLTSYIDTAGPCRRYEIIEKLREGGFEVLLSIGEAEENLIGSNCGQYVMRHLRESRPLEASYTYDVDRKPLGPASSLRSAASD
jgi:23S rRNA (adenine2503-C2)-methyltransferase